MRKRKSFSAFQAFLLLLLTMSCIYGQGQQPSRVLRLAETIPLSGVQGGFDHFAYDGPHGRLFLAASDNGTVEVLDVRQGKRTKSIAGFKNPHSILFRPGASTLLVTDSGPDASALLSATTLRKVRQLPLALGANCILFDGKKVYVTAGGDRVGEKRSTLLAADPNTGAVLKSINVDALHLQPMALDEQTGRLFVNLADQNAIAIYRRDTLTSIGMWHISKGNKNSPIAWDAKHRRLFVIASDPGVLLELSGSSGRLLASVLTPPTPDDMAFDPATQRLFVPGDGTLAVYDVSAPAHIKLLQTVQTGADARTGILFASGRRFAVAVPATKNREAQVLIFDVR